VPVASLVPSELEGTGTPDEFMSRLCEFDSQMAAKAQAAAKEVRLIAIPILEGLWLKF
jgi:hypothetical protein